MPAAMTARLTECIEEAEHPERVRVLGTLWVCFAAASTRHDVRELLARAVAFGFWHVAFALVVASRAIVAFLGAIESDGE
jgi:hypothetical protein